MWMTSGSSGSRHANSLRAEEEKVTVYSQLDQAEPLRYQVYETVVHGQTPGLLTSQSTMLNYNGDHLGSLWMLSMDGVRVATRSTSAEWRWEKTGSPETLKESTNIPAVLSP